MSSLDAPVDTIAPTATEPITVSKPEKQNRLNYITKEIGLDDLDVAAWVLSKAFLEDRLNAYYGDYDAFPTAPESPGRMQTFYYYKFVMKAALLKGGRIVVATTTDEELSINKTKLKSRETIAGVACWWPPHKRLPLFNVPFLLRCGVWKVLKGWGLTGLKRAIFEYGGLSEKTHRDALKTYSDKYNLKGKQALTPHDCWYLNLVMTVKEFEGRGVLSKLIREGYEHARKTHPGPVILESTSERSRDRYAHLGFEVERNRTIMGVGKVDRTGLKVKRMQRSSIRASSNEEDAESLSRKAEGVEYYCMVNWDPQA